MPDMPGDTNLHIGRMDGRLTALESRIDRHESFVGTKLGIIEAKLDEVLMAQASGLGSNWAFRWIVGVALSVGAWLHGHYTQPPGTH